MHLFLFGQTKRTPFFCQTKRTRHFLGGAFTFSIFSGIKKLFFLFSLLLF